MTLLHQAAQKAVEAKQREAFEHWYSDAGRWPKSVARGEDGHYLLAQTNSSYEAWRAAAAALQQQPEPVATEEAAYQRGKRAGYIDGYRAAHADERQQPDISPALQHQEVPREPVAVWQSQCKDGTWADCTEANARAGERYGFAARALYASPSTTRQQEVGIANGELSKPMPTLLAQRIVGALECGALWAEGSEAHPRILKTLADFNTWIVRQDAVSALSDEEIAMIARGMPMPPWGIGSRREDAIAFARKVLAAAPSTPEKAGGVPACTYLHASRVDGLIAVMEGECDGLAVTRETAEAILHYLDGNAPPVGVPGTSGGQNNG